MRWYIEAPVKPSYPINGELKHNIEISLDINTVV